MKMKISFKKQPDGTTSSNTPSPAPAAPAATPVSELPASSAGPTKLKIRTLSQPALNETEADKKPKRQYTKKPKADDEDGPPTAKGRKRKAEDGDDTTPAKRPRARPVKPTVKIPVNGRGGSMKIKFSAKSAQTPRVNFKYKGSKPVRPVGVGYDSEDSEAEDDPAVESQFIMRMRPGEDCQYLREAIDGRKIGLRPGEGGADISMVFFDKEGRRGMVTIRGRHYAATLVDLPCIVEATKSWDKKSWMKSADICQMLLVTREVKDEEEAKSIPLPLKIDKESFQYPHGLTPPMHWVRKRRFRKRVSYRTIEAVENEVKRLIEHDAATTKSGGKTEIELLDLEQMRKESEQAEEEEEEEEEEDEDGQYYQEGDEAEMEGYFDDQGNEDALEQMMEAEFEMGDAEDGEAANAAPSIETAAQHALQTANGATPAAETPSASATDDADGDGDDDDADDDDDGEEMDEEELRHQQDIQAQHEEVAQLQQELSAAIMAFENQTNPLLKVRAKTKVQSLQQDLNLKRAALGIE